MQTSLLLSCLAFLALSHHALSMEKAKNVEQVAERVDRAPTGTEASTATPASGYKFIRRIPSEVYQKAQEEQDEKNKVRPQPKFPGLTAEALEAKQLEEAKHRGYTG